MIVLAMLLLAATAASAQQIPQPSFSYFNFWYVIDHQGTFWEICVDNHVELVGSTPGHPYGFLLESFDIECNKSTFKPRQHSASEIELNDLHDMLQDWEEPMMPHKDPPLEAGYAGPDSPLPFAPAFSRSAFQNAGQACNPSLNASSYVVNHSSGTVTAISACPGAVSKVINVGSNPLQVSITPDATTAVVTRYDQSIAFIDTATNTVSGQLATNAQVFPNGIDITPDGTKAYVTSYIDFAPAVIVVDLAARSVVNTIPMPYQYPAAVTITPDGSQAWVNFLEQDHIVVIDTLTNSIGSTINSIGQPVGMTFDRFGTRAYIASYSTGFLYVLDAKSYDTVASIKVGNNPIDVAVTADGRWVFVTNTGSDFVSVIDADTNTVVDQVTVGVGALGFTLVN